MSDELRCQSFVFFDLETTGLIRQEADGGRTRVTEMSFIRIAREELSKIQSDLPRVLHKLTVTMNPQKNLTEQVFKLTGKIQLIFEFLYMKICGRLINASFLLQG